jgi:two-component system nitrogen regulation response regulator GlnG
VTAPGAIITAEDIPGDLGGDATGGRAAGDWTRALAAWADGALQSGATPLLETAQPEFEKTLIEIALARTNGHRQEAAKLLGWGRNTLTRKLKALRLE